MNEAVSKETLLLPLLLPIIEKIVSSNELHARWLNSLSLMENTGAKKIVAFEDDDLATEMVLKHAAEEARHAYFLKKQISKLFAVPSCLTYEPRFLLAPNQSRRYLHRLDVAVCQFLKKIMETNTHSLRYLAYLLVTYLIEVRADLLYGIYQRVLDEKKSMVNVKSIIAEEEGHLDEMERALNETGYSVEPSIVQMDRQITDSVTTDSAQIIREDSQSEELEEINYFIKNKVSINTASKSDLQKLPLLTGSDVEKILALRKTKARLTELDVRVLLGDRHAGEVLAMLSFEELIYEEPKWLVAVKKGELWKQVEFEYLSRFHTDFTSNANESGAPFGLYNRMQLRISENLFISALIEKDPGEELFWDFYSLSLEISNIYNLKKLVIGDFNLRFGQGLIIKTGSFSLKNVEFLPVGVMLKRELLSYTSATERNFFRGVACEAAFERFKIIGFYSNVGQDAMTLDDGTFTGVSVTGSHVTSTEIVRRNNLIEQSYGGRMVYEPFIGTAFFNVAVSVLRTEYSLLFQFQNSFDAPLLTSHHLTNVGTDFLMMLGASRFYGEFAMLVETISFAGIIGFVSEVTDDFSIEAVFRHSQGSYFSPKGSSLVSQSQVGKGEFGILASFAVKLFSFVSVKSLIDISWQPTGSKTSLSQAIGSNFQLKAEADFNKQITLRIYLQRKGSETNQTYTTQTFGEYDIISGENYWRSRAELEFQPVSDISLKTRVEIKVAQNNASVHSFGWLFYQQVDLFILKRKIKILTRGMVFNTNSSESGIYTYELRVPLVSFSPVRNGTGRLYKIEIATEGVYKLQKSFFDALGESAVNPKEIRLFYNGGEEINTTTYSDPLSDPKECAIWVFGGEDGSFDDGDYVLFYAKTNRGVILDPISNKLRSYVNEQSRTTYAILSLGSGIAGKRMASVQLQNPTSTATVFESLSFEERESEHFSITGKRFFDSQLIEAERVYQLPIPAVDVSQPVTYSFRSIVQAPTGMNLSLIERDPNDAMNSKLIISTTGISPEITQYLVGSEKELVTSSVLNFVKEGSTNDTVQIIIKVSGTGAIYPDKLEVRYQKRFAAIDEFLNFNSIVKNPSQVMSFEHQGFKGSQINTLDITYLHEQIIVPTGHLDASSGHEYVSFSERYAFKSPKSWKRINNQNLKGIAKISPQYVIIYPTAYEQAAEKLLAYRTNQSIWGEHALKGVKVEIGSIYNEFACGGTDYTAIRNFIHYLYTNAPSPPEYVVLFGKGSWDFRSIIFESNENDIPTYESSESVNYLANSTMTDDFFTYMEPNNSEPKLAIGRLLVSNATEAQTAVQKIIDYENNADYGDWRNKVLMLADDGPNGIEGNRSNAKNQFTDDTEKAIDSLKKFSTAFLTTKLYLGFYSPLFVSRNVLRPTATDVLIEEWNKGIVALGFIGHGNSTSWTAEKVFDLANVFPKLKNKSRLPLVVTATCDFARFDNPFEECGAEALFKKQDGGAVALISTVRSVFISNASIITPKIFSRIFSRQSFQSPQSTLGIPIGKIVQNLKKHLKQTNTATADIDKFILIGDPAMRLFSAGAGISIDSINGMNTENTTLTMSALTETKVSGTIQNENRDVLTDFNGNVDISIFDAPTQQTIDNDGDGSADTETYPVTQSLIYRGTHKVEKGRFASKFVVPKTITNDPNKENGLISTFAWKAEGAFNSQLKIVQGGFNQFRIASKGTPTNIDAVPPAIEMYLDDESFVSGGITSSQPILFANVFDESGINLTRAAGHAISLFIDEKNESPIILNDYYQITNDYKVGSIQYALPQMTRGNHRVKLRLADTFGNQAEKVLNFTVGNTSQLTIARVVNIPNPFEEKTIFVFDCNISGLIEVEIRIYTVRGTLVKIINELTTASRQLQVPWDGRDGDGGLLSNGVYFYKLIVRSQMDNTSIEQIEKLVIFR
ncbi:hypothetical protein CHS0354_023831 [Potamilus streckersoni]|uniref:Gingipain domain-containing protein n=1 Tax=Potamilus streckersoni TaxID=2493646 RepID=A0AAE0RYY1_9BIVA|nr:hypothetical protein CHS0354_023831 [Potamilus streckersoni]